METDLETHFTAIKSIIEPYQGHRIVGAIPGALSFIIQFSMVAPKVDSSMRARLLRELDSITSLVGKLGDIVSPDEFERIKHHYSEIQLKISSTKDDAKL